MSDDIVEAWQIREFPRLLRQEIVNEAKQRQMSPGHFATRIFTAAKAAGWEAPQTVANGLTTAELTAIAGNRDIAQWLRSAAARRLGAMMGVTPPLPPARRKALPAPEPIAEAAE